MAIRKFSDLENETDAKFERLKEAKQRANIAQVFEETTINEHGIIDEAIQFLNQKLDECIDTINANNAPVTVTYTLMGAYNSIS